MSTLFFHFCAACVQCTTSETFSQGPKLIECSLFTEIDLCGVFKTLEKPIQSDLLWVKLTDFYGINLPFKVCMDWSVDWRTIAENMDRTRSRGLIDTDNGDKLKRSLSCPGSEGLDMCSTVEMNSLLIQSKCNGKLPSIYKLYNLFTISSEMTFWISLGHFSLPNTWHCGKNFMHLSLLAFPETSRLAVTAFIIETVSHICPFCFPQCDSWLKHKMSWNPSSFHAGTIWWSKYFGTWHKTLIWSYF